MQQDDEENAVEDPEQTERRLPTPQEHQSPAYTGQLGLIVVTTSLRPRKADFLYGDGGCNDVQRWQWFASRPPTSDVDRIRNERASKYGKML